MAKGKFSHGLGDSEAELDVIGGESVCRREASGLRKLRPAEVWSQGFWSGNSGA